ncbi:MAG: SpoIID/LytB domain-containing protein [Eubacteriales bacterium]|nr:SpoIID/LytB domain-containing protein [Eubacteriales bacterium]
MKKIIYFMVLFFVVPCGVVFVASCFTDQIQIGYKKPSIEQFHSGINVLVERDGLYKNIDLEEYVLGVLPNAIPANYHEETLKAQAILIRTNAVREMNQKNTNDAEQLSYQYLTVNERKELFGEVNAKKMEEKMQKAVMETAGQVLSQNDVLIMAAYHEISMGKTASANEILGKEIPYLQSVDSSQDVEAKAYMSEKIYLWKQINGLLEQEQQGNNKVTIQILESSKNGYVQKVKVGKNEMSGEETMRLFDLASTNFYIEEQGNGIKFVCLGKGNGMGLSIYGANYMAQQGSTYKEILDYYYQNVSITDCKKMKSEPSTMQENP